MVVIPPAPASVTAIPTDGPVNDTAPPTFKFNPILTLFSTPIPPSVIIEPLSLLVDSVAPDTSNGSLISTETGAAVAYAIFNLQERGVMYIEPQTKVYKGMVLGEHNKENDLEINVLKGKQLTNVRASGSDKAVVLVPKSKII